MKLGKRLLVAAATALAVMAGAGAQPAQALEVNASWQNTGGRWWYLWTASSTDGAEVSQFVDTLRIQQDIWCNSFNEPKGNFDIFYMYPVHSWVQINGKWYHFDGDGWMQTGWIESYSESAGGYLWYYLEPSGAMAANKWVKSGSKWYYLAADGHMVANAWAGDYFLGYDGAMADDAWVDGYYVDASGKWRRDVRGYRSGTYVVGRDIPAGEYKLVADNGGTSNEWSHWQGGSYSAGESEIDSKTLFSDSFERGSWTYDGIDYGRPLVHELENGQVIKVDRASLIPLADYSKVVAKKSHLESGDVYKVGLEIPAGTYRLTAVSGYTPTYTRTWEEMEEVWKDPGSPKTQELRVKYDYQSFVTSTTVTVNDGDYLKLYYCTGDLIS